MKDVELSTHGRRAAGQSACACLRAGWLALLFSPRGLVVWVGGVGGRTTTACCCTGTQPHGPSCSEHTQAAVEALRRGWSLPGGDSLSLSRR